MNPELILFVSSGSDFNHKGANEAHSDFNISSASEKDNYKSHAMLFSYYMSTCKSNVGPKNL
jgi:hypothetical protein